MGAEPWHYFVPYEQDVNFTLQKLREREFKAGRYYGSEHQPESIEEALSNQEEEGTESILDMEKVGDSPNILTVCPLSQDDLFNLFRTDKPTIEMVRSILVPEYYPDLFDEETFEEYPGGKEFWESIGRGEGRYILIYDVDDDEPFEIFFAGYSFD
ncbi:MAG: hypothetical protein WBA07_04445 [Rivularia sp. (in: cyanobacteria)]